MGHSSGLLLGIIIWVFIVWGGVLSCGDNGEEVVGHGYRLISIEKRSDGSLIGCLELIQSTHTYGPDIPLLQLYVKHEIEDRVRVHITNAKKKRWEVPYNILHREQVPNLEGRQETKIREQVPNLERRQETEISKLESNYFEFSGNELIFSYTINPFGFAISRKSNGDILFNSSYRNLVFKDQYLEITTSLPKSASLYGLGENTQSNGIKILPNKSYTLFTNGSLASYRYTNLYGSHPFYMDLRKGGVAHGVLLLNSNGMDIFYTGSMLEYKIIGGILDFYFFAGTSPLDVVQQYTTFIGHPAPMPYWAFGFHQCKFGYKNVEDLEYVVDNYMKSQIPLDVMWTDDNYMDGAKDFTLDPINFPQKKLRAFVDRIHSNGQKYVVIVDPGISVNSTYATFQRGMALDIFIKHDGEPFLGAVWPGAVYFPDFLNPKTTSFWVDEISQFYKMVPVDGLWIDMNEITNWCTGKCTIPNNQTCPTIGGCPFCCTELNTQWDDPPYKINAFRRHAPLGSGTIATSSIHYNGILEYDAHNLYGLSETIATHVALQKLLKKRPFILSRSTFVGSGAYTAHWTGDIHAAWEDLGYSISTILRFGMFGIPMVGADICGFYGGTNEELCARWIQLGAFYPFSRNHADYDTPRQELYLWDSVAKSARKALGLRYKLLPYIYTLNYEAHMTGAPIARPLFFSFPEDEETYSISTQFLIGPSVLVSPVLQKETTTVTAYFPKGSWYNLNDMKQALTSVGEYVNLIAPLDTINVHVCGGTILPMQQGGLTTVEARRTPFTLVVTFPTGLNCSGAKAKGQLFLDNGEDLEMKLQEASSTYVEFFAELDGEKVTLISKVQMGKYAIKQGWVVKYVVILGPPSFPLLFHTSFPIGESFNMTWNVNKA